MSFHREVVAFLSRSPWETRADSVLSPRNALHGVAITGVFTRRLVSAESRADLRRGNSES